MSKPERLSICKDSGFPGRTSGKEPTCQRRRYKRRLVRLLGWEDALEGMAPHPSILAWRIPWTEEAGGLQLMGDRMGDGKESDTTEVA